MTPRLTAHHSFACVYLAFEWRPYYCCLPVVTTIDAFIPVSSSIVLSKKKKEKNSLLPPSVQSHPPLNIYIYIYIALLFVTSTSLQHRSIAYNFVYSWILIIYDFRILTKIKLTIVSQYLGSVSRIFFFLELESYFWNNGKLLLVENRWVSIAIGYISVTEGEGRLYLKFPKYFISLFLENIFPPAPSFFQNNQWFITRCKM